MGQETRIGNNTTLSLDVDSREEADRLYGALSEGGSDASPPAGMPWGTYWASSSTVTASAGWSTTPRHPERPSAPTFAGRLPRYR
jgi:hypothetical protein